VTVFAFDDSVIAYYHLKSGVDYLETGRFAEAIENFDQCLALTPNDEIAHWNLAIALLCSGDYVRGFVELEWRWRVFDWCWGLLDRGVHRIKQVPDWRGEDLRGKRLFYMHEQGYGDAILMLRYLPMLIETGAEITALTVPPLERLVARFGIRTLLVMPADPAALFDYRCPVFGPMVVTKQTVTSVPTTLVSGCSACSPASATALSLCPMVTSSTPWK
jgi:TPR repeat